jgi:hypothetical protein
MASMLRREDACDEQGPLRVRAVLKNCVRCTGTEMPVRSLEKLHAMHRDGNGNTQRQRTVYDAQGRKASQIRIVQYARTIVNTNHRTSDTT